MDTINSGTGGNAGNGNIPVSARETVPPPVPAAPAPGKARVAIGFLQTDTDAELIVDSESIAISMTGNPAFPTPTPTLAELAAARNGFIAAVSAGKDSALARATRREKRTTLTGVLRRLAHYVQMTSAGDRPTLLGTGFPLQRARAPVGVLPPPAGVNLVRGKASGQLIARCKPNPQAGAYHWRIGPVATPMVWQSIDTTLAAHMSYEGMSLYTQYTVQVRAIGTAGPSDWSDVASVVVV